MPRAQNQWLELAQTIDDLFAIARTPSLEPTAARAARATYDRAFALATPEDRARYVLDSAAFRRLFEGVEPSAYVVAPVAAAYHECSVLTLGRRLNALHSASWRRHLRVPEPARLNARGRFRWSFVTSLVPPFQALADTTPAARQAAQTKLAQPPMAELLLRALDRRFRYLVDAQGRPVAWGRQASMTAEILIAVLNAGGRFVELTAVEALGRPWVDPAARAPWQHAVTTVLTAIQQQIDVANAVGQAEPLANMLDSAPARKAPRGASSL